MDSDSARSLAESILTAWNSRNYDDIKSRMAPDLVYVDHTRARTAVGPEAYIDRFRRVLRAYADMQGETVSVLSDGKLVVHETAWHGTHTEPLDMPGGGALPPSHEVESMFLVTYLELDDGGRVRSVRTYGNPHSVPVLGTVGVG